MADSPPRPAPPSHDDPHRQNQGRAGNERDPPAAEALSLLLLLLLLPPPPPLLLLVATLAVPLALPLSAVPATLKVAFSREAGGCLPATTAPDAAVRVRL